MEHELIVNNAKYQVDAEQYAQELMIPVANAIEAFIELQEQFEMIEADYNSKKQMLLKMCEKLHEEIGFKSLKGEYGSIVYVPENKGNEVTGYEEKLDEIKMLEVLVDEYGRDPAEFLKKEPKLSKARKGYIKVK